LDFANEIGKSRQYVQQWLGGEGETAMTARAAHTLINGAWGAGWTNEREHVKLQNALLRACPPEIDLTLYVMIGDPTEAIMAAFADVRLAGKTRQAIRQKITRTVRRILKPTTGPNAQFGVTVKKKALAKWKPVMAALTARFGPYDN
jgi:hypothetical protein